MLLGLVLGSIIFKRTETQTITETVFKTDTVLVYDTTVKYITETEVVKDTVIITDTIPSVIDTSQIIADYYSKHVYNRTWEDSSIIVELRDTITENTIISSDFSYRILRPQQKIINETIHTHKTFARYLSIGAFGTVTDDFNIVGPSVSYTFRNGSVGLRIGINEEYWSLSYNFHLFSF